MKTLLFTAIAILGLTTITNAQVPSYVPTNGLVGYWPFNGNANDSSTNNLGGNVLGGPTLTTDRNGNSNASYDFDYSTVSFGGQTDEVYIPYNSILNSTNISVSVWVYPRSYYWSGNPGTSAIIRRFEYGYNNPNGQTWGLDFNQDSLYAFIIEGASNNAQNSAIVGHNTPLSLNTWHHIVFTYNGASLKLYLDGALVNSVSTTLPLNTAGNSGISVGESNQANGYWFPTDGKIDDIGIWNRALTQQEVSALNVSNNVGINENTQDNLFSVFPNPAQSVINVKADNKLIGEVYSIYDNTGRVVLSGKLNSENTTIELGNLSGGIYMFRVGENMKQTFKMIKE